MEAFNNKILPGRVFTILAAAGIGTAFAVAPCAAQEKYPANPVTLITLSKPGGGTDVYLREMIKYLAPELSTNLVVKNVLGGSGAVAMAETAGGAKDGSVLFGTTPTYVLVSLLSQTPVTYKDFEPVANVFYDPQTIYTRSESQWTSFQQLIEAAKKDPQSVKFGVTNPGSFDRQIVEKVRQTAGITSPVVTHDGGGELILDVLNGTVDVGTGELNEIAGQIEAGKVRVLATFTDKRLDRIPDVPTATEAGVPVVVHKFRGLVGPKGMSPEAVAMWEKAIPKVLDNPDFKEWYEARDMVPAFMPHGEYQKMITEFADEQHKFFVENGLISE